MEQSEAVCRNAAEQAATAIGDLCVTTSDAEGTGFMWGMVLSVVGDIIISVGLALQKVAHNRRAAAFRKGVVGCSLEEGAHTEMSSTAPDPATEPEETGSVYGMPVWWLGMVLTISGEIGNFAAYGDVNTPASVVTSVGCVGVITNVIIATTFLGEPFRWRDVFGCSLVVGGVLLLVAFAPQQACKLTGERFYWLLHQPGSIALFVLLSATLTSLYFLTPIHGHKHVLWNLSMASAIGSLTVMASKAVSTFLNLTVQGWKDDSILFWDELRPSISSEDCSTLSGFSWREVNASADGCFEHGVQQLTNPALYVCILVLAGASHYPLLADIT